MNEEMIGKLWDWIRIRLNNYQKLGGKGKIPKHKTDGGEWTIVDNDNANEEDIDVESEEDSDFKTKGRGKKKEELRKMKPTNDKTLSKRDAIL